MNKNKMFLKKVKLNLMLIFISFLVLFLSCNSGDKKISKKSVTSNEIVYKDLPEIIDSGVLRVITSYSPTGYFLYKGKTMGFEYEIFKRLADHLGVGLEIVLAKNVDSVIPMLNRGEGDIIALGYTITSER
ncbi:MAG: transporter substrate-binding domain-containing protein [Flavobacteriaceae bacterium]|nr:MAG: transporter substrate-binding domain-containing protein [Flavobacteriaceae bacterium]